MIQANELRIGNWVYHSGVVINAQSITGKGISTDTYTPIGNRSLEEVSGIPLPEEWMLRLGFRQDGYYNSAKRWIGGYVMMFAGNGHFILRNYPLSEIKYVHQLQNLYFSLTGQELTLCYMNTNGTGF